MLRLLASEISDQRVLEAFARVPREMFVPPDEFEAAYEDRPLGIGFGQTISQPLIVAVTLDALDLTGDERALDVGTGSGYQAALLSGLCREVVGVERVPELTEQAGRRLRDLGYANVEVRLAGDELGCPELAPFDAIAVGAGAPEIPEVLVAQLSEGGRMVIPAGPADRQELLRVTRRGETTEVRSLGPCRFVPLVGRGGWEA